MAYLLNNNQGPIYGNYIPPSSPGVPPLGWIAIGAAPSFRGDTGTKSSAAAAAEVPEETVPQAADTAPAAEEVTIGNRE